MEPGAESGHPGHGSPHPGYNNLPTSEAAAGSGGQILILAGLMEMATGSVALSQLINVQNCQEDKAVQLSDNMEALQLLLVLLVMVANPGLATFLKSNATSGADFP